MNATLLANLEGEVPLVRACDVLGASRASHYRCRKPRMPKPPAPRESLRRLGDHERQAVIEVLHEPGFADQPPAQIHAALLSRGIYLASLRTWHRILASLGEAGERRHQRPPCPAPVPRLTAVGVNQVWTWDITKLAGPTKGIFYALYVMIDLFSRFVVRWLLADRESTILAQRLFDEAYEQHGITPGQLTLHSDRGSPMKGLGQLLGTLGVTGSFSRPRVSNDNAFSESFFKTTKYQPDYPRRFGSFLHARAWLDDLFTWYNHHHHHSSLAFFTPTDVYLGRVNEVAAVRQRALDVAYENHPERFVRGRPLVRLPPDVVSINPLDAEALLLSAEASVSS